MRQPVRLHGYRRADGTYGIRNHIAVISTVACANHVADLIASGHPNAVALTHQHGCDQLGHDLELFENTLLGAAGNGNVAAVLVVGLGCEEVDASVLAKNAGKTGKPTDFVIIQEAGGTTLAVEAGREKISKFAPSCNIPPSEMNWSDLIVGLKCGGSDFSSGMIANPAVGEAVKRLLDEGARVIFGETTELLGAEKIIHARAKTPKIEEFILSRMKAVEDAASDMGVDIRGAQPSPGNIKGGLSTIEEKSLGAVCKIGDAVISNVLEFGENCVEPGLSFMDTPGNDIEALTGMAAGGAQLIIFTTGRGTPMGYAIAPVLKVTGSKRAALFMKENIDVDLSSFFHGGFSIKSSGEKIFGSVVECITGKRTKSEALGHREFAIHRVGPTL